MKLTKPKGAGPALHKSADRQQMACLRAALPHIILRAIAKISAQFEIVPAKSGNDWKINVSPGEYSAKAELKVLV